MEISETPRGHHWSLTLLGIALIIMFAYYGESVLAVLFFAVLLSFMLSPVVQALEYLHLPRALAALISVVVLLAVLYGISAASYNQALIFADNVPKYSQKIRSILQPFRHRHAVSLASPAHGICDAGADRENVAELHCGEPPDRTADFGRKRGDFRVAARSVLLLHRLSQRLSKPGSVPGSRAGDGAADPGRPRATGARRVVGGGVLRGRPASFRAECSLSEAAGEPPENQSAGGHARPPVLGSGLGSNRTGASHSNHGRNQDCLRPRRVDETLRGLAGRIVENR